MVLTQFWLYEFPINALDTNKTKGEFVQRKALNICSAYR